MALIKCTECGHQVSDKAEICPSCGYKVSDIKKDISNSKYKNKYDCKINGVVHDLSFLKDIIEEEPDKEMIHPKIVHGMYKSGIFGEDALEALLFADVIKFNNNEIPNDYNEKLEEMRAHNRAEVLSRQPKCPTCSSTNIRKLGFFETGIYCPKTFRCNNCGYEW